VLTLSLPVRPLAATLALATRALVGFYAVYCSTTRACSDSLPCGEGGSAPRFYWNWS
jgi:hypothetical protein